MLDYKEILKIAARGLLLNNVRFSLSLVGIIIGIAGVCGIVVIGEGKEKKVREFVNRLGADIVVKPNKILTEKVYLCYHCL